MVALGFQGGNRAGAYLRQRDTLGDRGPAWVAENGGDRGDWSVVRSRKRKATQLEDRGRNSSRFSGQHEGSAWDKGYTLYSVMVENRVSRQGNKVWSDPHSADVIHGAIIRHGNGLNRADARNRHWSGQHGVHENSDLKGKHGTGSNRTDVDNNLCRYSVYVNILKCVAFYLMYTWLDNSIHVVRFMALFDF